MIIIVYTIMCVFICVSLRQNYYTSHEFLRDNINIAYIEGQKYVTYFGNKLRIDMLLTFLRVGRRHSQKSHEDLAVYEQLD